MRLTLLPVAMLLSLAARSMYVQFDLIIPETCNNSNGRVDARAGGGVLPYTFSWSNGATTESIVNVPAGTYTLTVTDGAGTEVSDEVIVPGYPYLPLTDGGSYTIPDGIGNPTWGGACAGQCNGRIAFPWESAGGTPPFNVSWNASSQIDGLFVTLEGALVYGGFCLNDNVTYTYSDALGCTGNGSFTVIGVDSVPNIEAVHGACSGGANGRVEIYCPQMMWSSPSMSIYRDDDLVTWPAYPNWPAQTVIQVQGLIAGDYELRMDWMGACPAVVPFTIPALAVPCGTVSGTVFLDGDQNCQPDADEFRMPYQVLSIGPVDDWVLTGSNGAFEFALPNGSYTLGHAMPGIVPLCPLPQPVPFTVNSDATVIQLADSSTAPLDVSVYLGGTVARPGFSTSHHAMVRDLSAKPSGVVQVVHTFDPMLTYVDASPAPTSIVGNTITWDLSELTAFGQQTLAMQFEVPIGTPLGTVLNSSIFVTCALTEDDITNNTAGFSQLVTGSFDPNDKRARTNSGLSGEVYLIDQDEWMDYTIRFQNTGTDTAFTVVVTDTLSEFLDMASFQQGAASHAFDVAFKPHRVVQWTFTDILLPDSNVNEAASHGLVTFRIEPVQPLVPGIVIENLASIYFDFNEPVITEPSVLTAEFSTGIQVQEEGQGQVRLLPNPVDDQLMVRAAEGMIEDLRIFSMDGRTMFTGSVNTVAATIATASFPEGVYILATEFADGHSDRRSFTVLHP